VTLSAPAPVLAPRAKSKTDALCLHCRQPLPGGADTFCCSGCERVHELLQTSGLDRYYALRGDSTLSPVGDKGVVHTSPWLDALVDAGAGVEGVRRVAFDVQGIQCGACVWLIEALFRRMPDAVGIDLNPALGRATCTVGSEFPLRDLVAIIEDFGYRCGPATKDASSKNDALLLRTGVCGALAMNTMFLSAQTYFGLPEGALHDLIINAGFALTTLSTLIGGSYFVDRAYQGLRRGVLHLDLPIAVGMGLAYAGSVWSVYFGGGSGNYFDTVSVFIAPSLASSCRAPPSSRATACSCARVSSCQWAVSSSPTALRCASTGSVARASRARSSAAQASWPAPSTTAQRPS
jgi:P-type Cu2+ transporter